MFASRPARAVGLGLTALETVEVAAQVGFDAVDLLVRDLVESRVDPLSIRSRRPPCGFWGGNASAHRIRPRITASGWDTFDQATAGPSLPLLS